MSACISNSSIKCAICLVSPIFTVVMFPITDIFLPNAIPHDVSAAEEGAVASARLLRAVHLV